MEIMRKRALKISMGDYESFDTDVFVKVSHQDVGFSDEEWVAAAEPTRANAIKAMHLLLIDQVDEGLADDIADAQTLTGNRKSFVHRIPTTEKD